MRLKPLLIRLTAFALAGVGCTYAAIWAVETVERRSVIAVQETLMDGGHSWASVLGDGLQIVLEGEAPTEAVRFRAIAAAGSVVDSSRVIDNLSVADTEEIAPPDFALEILRNDSGISLIGLLPSEQSRRQLMGRVTALAGGLPVTDLLQVAEHPVPEGWSQTIDFAIIALRDLPRSKISVSEGRINIIASADSAAEQRQIEAELLLDAPPGITVELDITALRPVITPFILRLVKDANGARFAACAADSIQAQELIISAARGAGIQGVITCPIGLGVPSNDWAMAVTTGIAALDALGGGILTFSDADVTLVAAQGTDAGTFDTVVSEFEAALPQPFVLEAVLPEVPDSGTQGPPTFTATLSPEGQVQLRGQVSDELMNSTVANFALARFGQMDLNVSTQISEGLPRGWSVRVLAAVEALSLMSNGSVRVEPDMVTVRGNSGDEAAAAAISVLMIDKLGSEADFSIDVSYVEALDPIAGIPTAEECVGQIVAVAAARKITFEPGSSTLSAEALPILDDIAEILQVCADLRIEIAGYTDSQGREEMNQQLSQQRANAVLDALRLRRVPVSSFVAVGYGEADPIADNDTEEGREANRRIEFNLIVEDRPDEEPTALEELEAEAEADPETETTEDE